LKFFFAERPVVPLLRHEDGAAPVPVWLRPGGTAYFGINKNACIVRDIDLAAVIRVIRPAPAAASASGSYRHSG
jgi:hypothetical protein